MHGDRHVLENGQRHHLDADGDHRHLVEVVQRRRKSLAEAVELRSLAEAVREDLRAILADVQREVELHGDRTRLVRQVQVDGRQAVRVRLARVDAHVPAVPGMQKGDRVEVVATRVLASAASRRRVDLNTRAIRQLIHTDIVTGLYRTHIHLAAQGSSLRPV